MGFASTCDVARDADHVFRKQVAGALHSIAVDIIGESPTTERHADRLTWARRITTDADAPFVEAGRWMWLMLTNATFAADPLNANDGAVKTIATSFLDTMIGR